MKKFLITLALMLIIGMSISHAQAATDSWAFGFGFSYPRFVSVNIQPLNSDYGAFLSLKRNFSEYVGLRLKGSYNHLEGQWTNSSLNVITESTNLITGDLDLLFYLIPCKPVSPYLFAGAGAALRTLNNYATTTLDANETALSFNVGGGVEWSLDSQWKILTEYGYHTMFNSELDGAIVPVPTEVNGRDSYMTINLGLLYYFDKGKPSKLCEPCQGITMEMNHEMKDMTDYNRIEDMIKKHIPKEITKEVVVDRYIKAISEDRLVLIGVNFAFDKSDLLPESYPVLDKAVDLLNDKSGVNVEIEGYCDYIGTVEYNQVLSVDRAKTVKTYLVSKGINENRLTTIGYGKSNPIADNETADGRAMNRRIVFRIIK
ncbi:MAG: OmpA family protein [Ignavibacteriales bacterium]|nr:OmpA family protein [Ignavibacteriales bacterium]